ncbi:MAG: VWA domain-containing protein [Gammaproteobacteria bacterium]|nr:MAG: VWA domain-containing protein [Gammaproteobacteria bacterium]UCH39634.1 MAG: VWA domain-containing protein [Gammaproteobacteria bacterium]
MIEQFHFLRPAWLLLLLPLGLLLWRLFHAAYDSGSWRSVIDARLLPFVLSGSGERRRGWMRWLLSLAALLAILALAGPTWEKLPQPVYQRDTALIIALDLSRSMNATDIKPSRLTRARHKIADILNLRVEGQTALLVYAADAFTVTPLTSDVDTILALLPVLDSGMMPAQGTRADRALKLAFELFENSGVARGDVLLISDGLSQRELQQVETELAASPGHRISVLAVGTPEGGPVPLKDGGFLKDRDGAIVIAEMLEDNLRRTAQLGGGVYATLSVDDIDINTLAYLMESSIDNRAARQAEYSADLWREFGPWLILIALPFAALAFRRGLIWLLPLVVVLTPPEVQALDWQSLWQNDNQRASRLFEQGEHAAAAELFEDSDWQASSSYRAGDYGSALETWQGLEGEAALYNRGNALARLGRLEEALEAYNALLRDNPQHADALYNKQAIEKFLEQQQQQQAGQQNEQQQQSQQQQQEAQQQDPQQGDQQRQGGPQDAQQQAQQDDASDSESRAQAESGSDPAADEPQQSGQQARQSESTQKTEAGEEEQVESEAEALARLDQQMSEQAAEQWLRKIPDDPGGLLRRKFLYQYRKRGGVDAEGQPW